ncbi:hypothetical protein TTHERM_00446370 (macronuclear) [Tetrahymena thermophila SB210]|uniref:Uncharacterized protein n=1 Tax=Tetrahymena thermophila (strain SB210) TaxID=312017 RepID=I7MHP1_TETTS|nr:hypothetical protein TTHERM_00446370 [Tetrahymena thermophila SB210]EAS03155.1 hypothetical protein TTHERM_00446370 [Tetrahymena thermophila SB210]|eukprot:XP_001023400.1 hypothetical protein TTHERM_00446370 [Tetrahymena thermophila SB210]
MENQTLFYQSFKETSHNKKQKNDDKADQNDLTQKKDDQIAKVNKNKNKNRCGTMPISFLLSKFISTESNLVLVGDILLEIFHKEEDDIDQLLRQASLLQDKKYVNNITYFKNKNIIQVSHNNKIQGCCDFQNIIQVLLQSQNQNNMVLAEELQKYWYHIFTVELLYKSLIQNRGFEYLNEIQQSFYSQNIDRFLSQNNLEECHAYFCISLLEKNELGIPLNVQYGISESLCAILGCGPNEMLELLSKTMHINLFLGREYMPYTNLQVLDAIRFNQQFYLLSEVQQWESEGKMYTLDGIFIKFNVKATQLLCKVDGYNIAAFVQTEFILDSTQIQNIIQIRQSKYNYYNSRNILDFLITDNFSNQLGLKFFNYITDKNNFKPPSSQDIYPHRTCKYRQIEVQKSIKDE